MEHNYFDISSLSLLKLVAILYVFIFFQIVTWHVTWPQTVHEPTQIVHDPRCIMFSSWTNMCSSWTRWTNTKFMNQYVWFMNLMNILEFHEHTSSSWNVHGFCSWTKFRKCSERFMNYSWQFKKHSWKFMSSWMFMNFIWPGSRAAISLLKGYIHRS